MKLELKDEVYFEGKLATVIRMHWNMLLILFDNKDTLWVDQKYVTPVNERVT